MEEIKVGEYVRTTYGFITKLDRRNFEILTNQEEYTIVKHSKNIIDLIEVGDYVNGYICRYITDIDTGKEYLCNYDLNEMRWIPLKDIDIWESVVTKEQFAGMEYRLED